MGTFRMVLSQQKQIADSVVNFEPSNQFLSFICRLQFPCSNLKKQTKMSKKHYFDPEDLKKFGNIGEWQKPMADKFFDWYSEVFKEGALTEREKALIALGVAHALQCPYCIDAYSSGCLEKGADEEQMMEAVQVAAAIRAGTTLVYSTQMMNHVKNMSL